MAEDLDDTVVPPRRPAAGSDSASATHGIVDSSHTIIVPRPAPRQKDLETGDETDQSIELDEPESVRFYAIKLSWRDEVIVLDAPCFIGRQPSQPRISSGAVPRLVKAPSPRKEVSASHLEVRQVGLSVIVTDLKSTNGSVVTVPGSAPRKLLQGESVVVSRGTLVDIGDNNILQILPMQSPVAG